MKDKIHLLLIGPKTNIKENLIGGATISFGYLVDYLQKEETSFTLITTQRFPSGKKRILNPLYVLMKVVSNAFKADVLFLNCSDKGIKYLAPVLYIITQLFRLKFVVRPFGGDFKDYTDKFSNLQKYFFTRTTLKADLLFLQTKKLIAYYASQNRNVYQLPTSRNTPLFQPVKRSFEKRFVYLGFVNQSKGIDHLLEVAKILDTTSTIHIYGPIRENYDIGEEKLYIEKFEEQKGIYQGVLPKEKVLETLSQYDVLVLPTYYRGEGYPGVIIEAYSLGLPVITTKWKAIPEIVEDGITGLLIEPKSTEELLQAMQFFNKDNYPAFSSNAKKHFKNYFSTEKVAGNAIAQIKALFYRNQSSTEWQKHKV